jgi:TIR domain/CHAT domain
MRCVTGLEYGELFKSTITVAKDFFISYNKADHTWAEWIAWVLEEHGYSVVIQAWDFRPGDNFVLDMQRASTETERTVMVLSDAYLNALYTQPEWAAAFTQDPTSVARKLLPIRVAPCQPKGMLAPLVYVDLVDVKEEAAEELVLAALKERTKPTTRPTFPQAVSSSERVTSSVVAYPGQDQMKLIQENPTETLVITKTKYEFVLTGNFDEVDKGRLEAIFSHLKKMTGDSSLTLLKVEPGSIKLFLEGSEDGFRLLERLVASGKLEQVMGIPIQTVKKSPKTILLLAANPKGTNQLRLGEESRALQTGLERSRYRESFRIEQRWAVTPRDMQRALLDCQPQIVHFSGHGVGTESPAEEPSDARKLIAVSGTAPEPPEGLLFEDATGHSQLVSAEAIASLFALFADQVECVVLNACYSKTQAEAISQHIDNVVGMKREIGDAAAIEFSLGFYDALLAGRTVEFAYQMGCNAIQMQGIPEHLTPVLIQRAGEESTNSQKTMPSQQTLAVDRLQLIRTLNALPAPQFEELLFVLNPPSGNVPGSSASQGSRSADLVRWVESQIGPGLAEMEAILSRIMIG